MYTYFPASGLAAFCHAARIIDDSVFLVAARTLASMVTEKRLEAGGLYPDQSELRSVAAAIAAAVFRGTRRGFQTEVSDYEIDRQVQAAMWYPDYVGYQN